MANFITKVDAGGLMHTLHCVHCTHCISENGGLRKGETTTGPSAKQAQSQMRAIDGMQDRCNFQIKFASNWKIGRPVQLSDYIVGLRRKTVQFADFVCT